MRYRILAFALAALAVPAEAKWREASSDHFVIYSEQSAKDLEEFASHLERYDKAMRFLRSVPDVPPAKANRLTVYVVSSFATVRKLFGEGAGTSRGGIGGFYLPRASGSIAIAPRPSAADTAFDSAQIVLLHEYAHHFMLENYPGAYPAWFTEGYAEFHSTASFERDGDVGIGRVAAHRAAGLLLESQLPIERLLTASVEDLPQNDRDNLYGRGWLLLHYLTFEPTRKDQLGDYLQRINRGEGNLEAARGAFGDLAKLNRELNIYMRRKMYYWRLPADQLAIGKVAVRDLTLAEDAVMDVKIRSRRGVTPEQAQDLLPEVRRAAEPYVNDPFAQATLAEAEYDAGHYREAEAAADRALAADPKYVDALLYKGRARLALADEAGESDAKTWSDARRWIVTANRTDPDDPEPLVLFYQSYRLAGMEPTDNAVLGLLTAYAAVPQDPGLRAIAAVEMLKKGDTAGARTALRPLAYDPHGGAFSAVALKTLELLQEKGANAALENMRKGPAAEAEVPAGDKAPDGTSGVGNDAR